MLFTYELARRLEGTGVTANTLHPGVVATNLLANNGLAGRVLNLFVRVIGRSADKGARTITYLATSTDVADVTGGYFVNETPVPSSQGSYDEDAALRLWRASEELTGLEAGGGARPE
jgi:NAD(P)-dependent dehydrogenase (short-subunit alcohol dehydrogenase family)